MSNKMSEREIDEAIQRIFEQRQEAGLGNPEALTSGMNLVTEDAGTFEAGAFFEAETVKGGKNYVIFAMNRNGWVYYFHGDRAKKTPESNFKKLISYGDLVPVPRGKVDIEKAALCVIGLNAMLNGLSFNDYLKVCFNYGDGSQAA